MDYRTTSQRDGEKTNVNKSLKSWKLRRDLIAQVLNRHGTEKNQTALNLAINPGDI